MWSFRAVQVWVVQVGSCGWRRVPRLRVMLRRMVRWVAWLRLGGTVVACRWKAVLMLEDGVWKHGKQWEAWGQGEGCLVVRDWDRQLHWSV